MPATAEKKETKPGVVDPQVNAPASRKPVPVGFKDAAYVYVPAEGLFARDGKTWHRASAGNVVANALRRNHHLSVWLTQHPLAVIYAHVNETAFAATDMFMGDTWVEPIAARIQAQKFEWAKLPGEK